MISLFWLFQITLLTSLFSLFITPNYKVLFIKHISLITSYCLFFIVILMGIQVQSLDLYQLPTYFSLFWIENSWIKLNYTVSIDSLSYIFMLLSTLLIPLCIIASWNNIKINLKDFLISLLLVDWMLVNMFAVTDLFLFYIWFEAILLPMYLLIGVWGSRQRKTYASFMFFFYTFLGSLFLLYALFLLYSHFGSLYLYSLAMVVSGTTLGYFVWPMIMVAFAVKVPMFPAHIWLPEAHVEAPTVGSVLLAGVLLKLGIFALLRFLIPIFPTETQYYAPVMFVLALIGILYISLTTIRQIDLKKIIAYASVAHMNYVVLGVFGTNVLSLAGAVFLMIGHGLVSAGLFFMIGFLYDRYKTRNIRYYRGLSSFMPLYALSFLTLSLANMSFPGTVNFIGEAIILFGLVLNNWVVAFAAGVGIIFCAIYTIWLFNRIMYGPISVTTLTFSDLSFKEFFVLFPLLALTLYLGLNPNYLFSQILDVLYLILENY